jgi:hypothetical protein
VTRGSEGLLEMTAVKTIMTRRGNGRRHYEATTVTHEALFDGMIAASHSQSIASRIKGFLQLASAGRLLAAKKRTEDKYGK